MLRPFAHTHNISVTLSYFYRNHKCDNSAHRDAICGYGNALCYATETVDKCLTYIFMFVSCTLCFEILRDFQAREVPRKRI